MPVPGPVCVNNSLSADVSMRCKPGNAGHLNANLAARQQHIGVRNGEHGVAMALVGTGRERPLWRRIRYASGMNLTLPVPQPLFRETLISLGLARKFVETRLYAISASVPIFNKGYSKKLTAATTRR